jgi:anti-sigma regulatory factor (Ser/Thr protein kinase)
MSTAAAISVVRPSSLRWPVTLGRFAGFLSTLLGTIVIVGWYTHNLTLLQISPRFVAMAYNAALAFVLCGVGMMASRREFSQPAHLISLFMGILTLAIGAVTVSEYITGMNLGLDELFMKSYTHAGVTAPGRMAVCTAFCFTLSGIALILDRRRFPLRPLQTAMIGSIVIGLGVVALSGYFSGIANSYAWGALTRMAVHTAVGFLILGLGVIAYSWQDDQSGPETAPRWLPIFVGVGVAAITLSLWQALVVEESTQQALIQRLAAASASVPLEVLARQQSLVPAVELGSGLLLALLMAGAVTLAQTAYRQAEALREAQEVLETRVTERTEALAQANDALKEVAGWQRGFLRDALASVTEGKLRLCDSPADLPPHALSFFGYPIFLTLNSGLSDLRNQALEAAALCNFAPERAQDLVTAVNEAGMNAIVHGGGGFARVSFSPEGTIQVRVTDEGKGITMENLPRATLSRGFTTAGTLGHGLKMILQTADRLWLLTGPTGTIVALEQDRFVPEPLWIQE